MYQISNFTDNDDVKTISKLGAFQVIEYQRDLSVTPDSAVTAYYSAQMNVKKRQLVCDLSKAPVTIQAGAMQWMVGNVSATTGVKGVGDFLGKAVRGKTSGESAIKPEYTGDGILVLEPTYKHLILMSAEGLGRFCDPGRRSVPGLRIQPGAQSGDACSRFSPLSPVGRASSNLSLNGRGVFCIESAALWKS